MSAFDGHLEPAAIAAGSDPAASAADIAALSAAISLKRIADTMDRLFPEAEGSAGTVLFNAIVNGIVSGTSGHEH